MSDTRRSVAIIGGGNMGADVALVFAAGGWNAHVVEPSDARRSALDAYFVRGLALMGCSAVSPERFIVHATLADVPWVDIEMAVECIPEKLDLKRALFAELERLARPDCTLASNSSSFPISEISAGLKTRSRMLGLHFFLPAHLVPLVEVIRMMATEPGLPERIAQAMLDLGKVPVHVRKDLPGFLANRMQHALSREAYALIDEGVATAGDIDAAVRFGFGFRYIAAGPALQRDHAGLEVHAAAATTTYPTLCNATVPAKVLREKVDAGHLGMKSGQGFYAWDAQSIEREKARYEGLLLAALALLRDELPRRKTS
jgi:3-hydroxybutyryl-CoA dehydrogenase